MKSRIDLNKIIRFAIFIQVFETKIGLLMKSRKLPEWPLSIGREFFASLICNFLSQNDLIFGSHRSRHFYIAKGGSLQGLVDELFFKKAGCCKGYGGGMQLSDIKSGFLRSSSVIAGTLPLSAGAGVYNKGRGIVVSVFGDGVLDEGVFYETINFSLLRNLPILFLCENDGFATDIPIRQHIYNSNITEIVEGFGMNSESVSFNINNLEEIFIKIKDIIGYVREYSMPFFLEIKFDRVCPHLGIDSNALKYLLEIKEKIINTGIIEENLYNKMVLNSEIEIDKSFKKYL